MRWSRVAVVLLPVLLMMVAGVTLFAQDNAAPRGGMSDGALTAFVITWVGFIIAVMSFFFMIRRDRIAQQERDEITTIKLVKRYVSDADFRKTLDERMIEVGRDLMFREFKVPETMAAVQQLSARVEALSRRVSDVPNEVHKSVSDAVENGVALGVTRAVEALDRERQKEMVHSDLRSKR